MEKLKQTDFDTTMQELEDRFLAGEVDHADIVVEIAQRHWDILTAADPEELEVMYERIQESAQLSDWEINVLDLYMWKVKADHERSAQ